MAREAHDIQSSSYSIIVTTMGISGILNAPAFLYNAGRQRRRRLESHGYGTGWRLFYCKSGTLLEHDLWTRSSLLLAKNLKSSPPTTKTIVAQCAGKRR